VTGFPQKIAAERVARISVPTKNVMQSGTDTQSTWVISFDTQERWENPLMGWSSS
jgi:NADH dehydrogenase (ubiquinone) Fe-S protein 4